MDAIRLSPDTWHVKAFLWSLNIWNKFRKGNFSYYDYVLHSGRANLCMYIRAHVYAAIAIVSNIAIWLGGIFSFIILPSYLFGILDYLQVVGIVGGIIVLVITVLFGLGLFREWFEDWRAERREKAAKKEERKKKESGFMDIVGMWIQDTHAKICRDIDISERRAEKNDE